MARPESEFRALVLSWGPGPPASLYPQRGVRHCCPSRVEASVLNVPTLSLSLQPAAAACDKGGDRCQVSAGSAQCPCAGL